MRRLLIALCVGVLPPVAVGAQQPADGPGSNVLRARCLGCHDSQLIEEQRLTRAGWDREVAKMERWSSQVPVPEREQLLDYLAGRFGVRRLPSADPVAVGIGQAVYARACLSCHDGTLVEEQRLSEAAWRRTVAKMVQWGANVEPSDVASLASYLASRGGRP